MSDHLKMHGEAAAPASWRQMLDERQRKAIAFPKPTSATSTTARSGITTLKAQSAERRTVRPGALRFTLCTLGDWLAREGLDEAVRTAARSLLAAPESAAESGSDDVPF